VIFWSAYFYVQTRFFGKTRTEFCASFMKLKLLWSRMPKTTVSVCWANLPVTHLKTAYKYVATNYLNVIFMLLVHSFAVNVCIAPYHCKQGCGTGTQFGSSSGVWNILVLILAPVIPTCLCFGFRLHSPDFNALYAVYGKCVTYLKRANALNVLKDNAFHSDKQ